MGERVTLVRPDGSTVQASSADADTLRTLGYKDQTPEQLAGEAVAASTEAYYTTPAQKAKTAVEGLLGGATLGLSDLALDYAGADTAERGQYNPGIRLGTELIGGLAPAFVPGLGLSPAGLLSKGAAAAAEGSSTAVRFAKIGAIEGAGFGGQAAISNSVINGDPLTTEAVVAGMGWGAVWGGGLGLAAGKVAGRVEARAAQREAEAIALRGTEEGWGVFRNSIKDAAEQTGKTLKAADEIFETFGPANAEKVVGQVNKAKQETLGKYMLGPDTSNITERMYAAWNSAEAKTLNKAAKEAYKDVRAAAKAADYEGLQEATARFKEHVTALGEMTGLHVPEISGFAAEGAKASTRAATELAEMHAAVDHLRTLPLEPEGFAKLTPASAEKAFGAVDTFMGGSHAELAGVRDGLKAGVEKLESAVGMTTPGSESTKLRAVYEHLAKSATESAAKDMAKAGPRAWQGAVASAASQAARSAGAGPVAGQAVYHLTRGLLGLKSAVVGGIGKAATDWIPRGIAKSAKYVSRIEPLKVRLDGTEDKAKATRKELMAARSREIYEAAGSVRDTMYKAVAPLNAFHPELAASVHALTVKQFSFIMDKLPMDPGLAFNRFKSLWSPDPVATEKFARYYQVFQNPVAVIQEVMSTGHVKPEWAEGLREMHPALFQQLRVDMLEHLSNPKILGKLSYNEQVSLGVLLQIPIHSTMTPQFVATQQQMYMERQQLMPMNAQPGAEGGGGRPSGPANSPYSSAGDKINAR